MPSKLIYALLIYGLYAIPVIVAVVFAFLSFPTHKDHDVLKNVPDLYAAIISKISIICSPIVGLLFLREIPTLFGAEHWHTNVIEWYDAAPYLTLALFGSYAVFCYFIVFPTRNSRLERALIGAAAYTQAYAIAVAAATHRAVTTLFQLYLANGILTRWLLGGLFCTLGLVVIVAVWMSLGRQALSPHATLPPEPPFIAPPKELPPKQATPGPADPIPIPPATPPPEYDLTQWVSRIVPREAGLRSADAIRDATEGVRGQIAQVRQALLTDMRRIIGEVAGTEPDATARARLEDAGRDATERAQPRIRNDAERAIADAGNRAAETAVAAVIATARPKIQAELRNSADPQEEAVQALFRVALDEANLDINAAVRRATAEARQRALTTAKRDLENAIRDGVTTAWQIERPLVVRRKLETEARTRGQVERQERDRQHEVLASAIRPYGFQLVEDTHIYGSVVGETPTLPTIADCARLCQRTPKCLAFAFQKAPSATNNPNHYCFLAGATLREQPDSGWNSGRR
jgi:hypothetical protein